MASGLRQGSVRNVVQLPISLMQLLKIRDVDGVHNSERIPFVSPHVQIENQSSGYGEEMHQRIGPTPSQKYHMCEDQRELGP